MATWLLNIRIGWAVFLALVVRVGRRLIRGPAVASWSWSVELRMTAVKAFITAAREHPDPTARTRLEERLDPPLPRRLRDLMTVRPAVLAGLDTELHEPVAAGLGTDSRLTMLYLHGGAYLAGSAATHRRWVANLSWEHRW